MLFICLLFAWWREPITAELSWCETDWFVLIVLDCFDLSWLRWFDRLFWFDWPCLIDYFGLNQWTVLIYTNCLDLHELSWLDLSLDWNDWFNLILTWSDLIWLIVPTVDSLCRVCVLPFYSVGAIISASTTILGGVVLPSTGIHFWFQFSNRFLMHAYSLCCLCFSSLLFLLFSLSWLRSLQKNKQEKRTAQRWNIHKWSLQNKPHCGYFGILNPAH